MAMIVSTFLKQLRKKLRLKRKWLSLGMIILAAGLTWIEFHDRNYQMPAPDRVPLSSRTVFASTEMRVSPTDPMQQINQSANARETFLQKTYLCGEEVQKFGKLKPAEIEKLHHDHPEWRISLADDGHVMFDQALDEPTSACRDGAFFGLNEKGILSLFDGLPINHKVIRTFFQLNMPYLESRLPQDTVLQLRKGIRVNDLAEYDSVLSTFSEYGISIER
jgi:forespore regulator of the sigma-K checkpoint